MAARELKDLLLVSPGSMYDPALLDPSSEAGSDYVQDPSQYKEMFRTHQRRELRRRTTAPAAADDAADSVAAHSDFEFDSDSESESGSHHSAPTLADREAASELDERFPIAMMELEDNSQPEEAPDACEHCAALCEHSDELRDALYDLQNTHHLQADLALHNLTEVEIRLQTAKRQRDAANLRLKRLQKAFGKAVQENLMLRCIVGRRGPRFE
ncbi:hypothetical protein K438DRAFT_1956889 [Mycena galopus ATCC 62051]|nr:hypothetical protein K438DRAFT_1956889 [Mycena galopus ATCC 62051]